MENMLLTIFIVGLLATGIGLPVMAKLVIYISKSPRVKVIILETAYAIDSRKEK